MIEEWKDIKHFERYYQISNLGNVKSLIRKGNLTEKVLKPTKSSRGYLQVSLFKDNKAYKVHVHRLVAEHFIDNTFNYPQINHKDENKLNNVVSNLEWCSAEYNSNYGTRTERIQSTPRGKAVLQLSQEGELIQEFASIIEAGKSTRICPSQITKACKGRYFDHKQNKWYNSTFAGNFKWKYKYKQLN